MANNKFKIPHNPLEGNALFETETEVAPVTATEGAPVHADEKTPKKRGKKPDPNVEKESGSRQGLQKGLTRRTMIFKESTLQDLIDFAELNGMTIKDAIDVVISSFMDDIRKHPERMQEATKRLQTEQTKKMREFMSGGKTE